MTSRKVMANHKDTLVPLSQKSGEDLENRGRRDYKPLTVYICTSAQAFNVQGLIDEIRRRFPRYVNKVEYVELPYNDIDYFSFEDMDVVILCHSIHNRRFAITDVMDALYDDSVENARKLNKDNRMVGVIAHDFPVDRISPDNKYKMNIEAFECRQPSAFKCDLVMMAGRLDVGQVDLSEERWKELEAALKKATEKAVPILPVPRVRTLSWIADFLCLFSFLLVLLDFITGQNWHEIMFSAITICLFGILLLDVAFILHFIKELNKWAFRISLVISSLEIVLLFTLQNWKYVIAVLSLLPVGMNGLFVYRHRNKLTKLMLREVSKCSARVAIVYVLLLMGLYL